MCACCTNSGTRKGEGRKEKVDEEVMTDFGSGVVPGQILVKLQPERPRVVRVVPNPLYQI